MTQESALFTLKTGANVFLTGGPGTGKTYVLNKYLQHLREHGVEVAITAPTGIAASHIGGVTLHSFFGVGIRESLSPYDIENLTEKKYLWERMKNLKVLVIDEVSMLSPGLFHSIDQILKTFKFSQEPFGGVQVILVGDFFQLPPVSKANPEKPFIFQHDTWRETDLTTCYLEKSYRHEDEILKNILSEIRQAKVSEDSMQHFRDRYRKHPEGMQHITKLYTHNMDVDAINIQELKKIDAPIKRFDAHTTGAKQWVEKVFGSSLVLPRLDLKEGSLVFFIKNNYEAGFINGTLGTVTGFTTFGVPIVTTHDGKEIKAERMEWILEDNDGKPRATIKQIPLRLAWAITIHKSQGMTLDAAEIDLSKAFESGQGYVALSRIKTLSGLKLMGLNKEALMVHPHVTSADANMRAHSQEMHEHIENLSEIAKTEAEQVGMARLGGSKAKGAKKKASATSEKKDASHILSKPFFEKEMALAEIAKERDLSEGTILTHLGKILKDDPEFDITYLQPDSHVIESVEDACQALGKKANTDHYNEDGSLKLKSIFNELGGSITYDEIKLSLLFLEE